MSGRVHIFCQSPKEKGWPPQFEGKMTSSEADSIARHYNVVFKRLIGVAVLPQDYGEEAPLMAKRKPRKGGKKPGY